MPDMERPRRLSTADLGSEETPPHRTATPRGPTPPPETELAQERKFATQLATAEAEVERIRTARNAAMVIAKKAGATGEHLASAAGISRLNVPDALRSGGVEMDEMTPDHGMTSQRTHCQDAAVPRRSAPAPSACGFTADTSPAPPAATASSKSSPASTVVGALRSPDRAILHERRIAIR